MKATVTTQTTIHSSPKEVFKYLTNLRYATLWNPQLRHISSQETLKLNSTYMTRSQVLGVNIEAHNLVTKFVKDKELQLENNTGLVHYAANFKIKSDSPNKVVLVCSTTVSADSKAFAFTKPVLKLLAARELKSDLSALKIAVENKLSY